MVELINSDIAYQSCVLENVKVKGFLLFMATVVSSLNAPFCFLQQIDLVERGTHFLDELHPDSL